MASLAELARLHTDLDAVRVGHLQRLVANWGILADFCFADLLLFTPVRGSEGRGFVVLGQVRPTTGQTVYRRDWVGAVVDEGDRPVVSRTFSLGEIIEGETNAPGTAERIRVLGIPVRFGDAIVAVLTRESAPLFGRQPGELERIYVDIFNRFARMIASGEFPFGRDQVESEVQARVGDGVILLDRSQRVEYNSPNAVSALHRMGLHANAEGMRLGELGLDDASIADAFAMPGMVSDEIERGPEVTVSMRCIPLVEQGQVAGAVVLLRDISELRRRDRLLLSKDATIREIHHRVKNNLQTISSLLRLQGRRLESPEAKAAIEESVRRVRSIALVHEILSRDAGGDAPFIDIVRPLCRMVEEALYTPERAVRCTIEGDAGTLPATVATPLAVVLNELLQNAYDHAFPDEVDDGQVVVELTRTPSELTLRVIDNGCGLPEGFSVEQSTGLGLSIVRTLVQSELDGKMDLARGDGGDTDDTEALRHPGDRPGTIVTIRIPLDAT